MEPTFGRLPQLLLFGIAAALPGQFPRGSACVHRDSFAQDAGGVHCGFDHAGIRTLIQESSAGDGCDRRGNSDGRNWSGIAPGAGWVCNSLCPAVFRRRDTLRSRQ